MAFKCVLHATRDCNDCMECKSVVNEDGTIGRVRWQDLDPQDICNWLAQLLSNELDFTVKIKVRKKDE